MPPDLPRPLAAPDALEDALERGTARQEPANAEAPTGTELLLFLCEAVPCAAPLAALREVLPTLPEAVALPHSPPWMLGIFPLRTEMVGLVDPGPLLLGIAPGETYAPMLVRQREARLASASGFTTSAVALATALVVGEGERMMALAVSAIGDIVLAHDEEISSDSQGMAHAASPLADAYIVGIYTPSGTHNHFSILNVERLLNDLVAALDHVEAERYG